MPDAEAPPETAADLFRALKQMLRERRLTFRYDFDRLQHIDCPVGSEADGNIWAYAILAVVLIAFWRGGWHWALDAGAAGLLVYLTLAKMYIRRRIRARIDGRALQSLEDWQRLWRFGGITLVPPQGEACEAPKGNWMELVRQGRGA